MINLHSLYSYKYCHKLETCSYYNITRLGMLDVYDTWWVMWNQMMSSTTQPLLDQYTQWVNLTVHIDSRYLSWHLSTSFTIQNEVLFQTEIFLDMFLNYIYSSIQLKILKTNNIVGLANPNSNQKILNLLKTLTHSQWIFILHPIL